MNFSRNVRHSFVLRATLGTLLFAFLQGVTYASPPIDHAAVLKSLNKSTLEQGKQIYLKACAACHGTNGVSSLPQARSFTKDIMRFGNKPYDMWKTITKGAGMMAAQTWLSPQERYYVVQYIRESFIRPSNKTQYFPITPAYLASLPKNSATVPNQANLVETEAKKGSLQYGQEWFSKSESDYGPAIYSQLQGHSTSTLTLQLAKTTYLSYDLLRMRSSALWQGALDVSQTKYKLYRGEGQPRIAGKLPEGLQTWEWLYSAGNQAIIASTSKRSVPPPAVFRYNGHYLSAGRVILSYAIEGREILEMPSAAITADGMVLTQRITISAGEARTLVMGFMTDSSESIIGGSLKPGGTFVPDDAGRPGEALLVLMHPSAKSAGSFVAVSAASSVPGLSWQVSPDHRMLLTIPAFNEEVTITVMRKAGKGMKALQQFQQYVTAGKGSDSSLSVLIKQGSATTVSRQFVKGIINTARPHFDPKFYKDKDKTSLSKLVNIPLDYPYTVDQVTLPYDNRYNAWIRPTAIAFRPDGDLFVSTYPGDIWLAKGVDSTLKKTKLATHCHGFV